jgi:Tfp pilus assembly protein PilX
MSNELERAEAHLRSAEAELHQAEQEEVAAVQKIEAAVEEIKAAEERCEIHFTVDGEPHETDQRELAPDEIIRKFGERDPSKNYLVQIVGGQKESYQGKGEIPIKMHDGMRVQILCIGPMTVSDGTF